MNQEQLARYFCTTNGPGRKSGLVEVIRRAAGVYAVTTRYTYANSHGSKRLLAIRYGRVVYVGSAHSAQQDKLMGVCREMEVTRGLEINCCFQSLKSISSPDEIPLTEGALHAEKIRSRMSQLAETLFSRVLHTAVSSLCDAEHTRAGLEAAVDIFNKRFVFIAGMPSAFPSFMSELELAHTMPAELVIEVAAEEVYNRMAITSFPKIPSDTPGAEQVCSKADVHRKEFEILRRVAAHPMWLEVINAAEKLWEHQRIHEEIRRAL